MPKPADDFAARMGRHLLTETDPSTITEPKKPDAPSAEEKPATETPATETPQGESSPESKGHGMTMADIIAEANAKKEADKAGKQGEKPAAEAKPEGEKPDGEKGAAEEKPEGEKKAEVPKKPRVGLEKAPKRTPSTPAAPLVEQKPAEPAKVEVPAEKSLDELAGVKLTDDEREYLELVKYAELKDEKLKGSLDREVKRIQAFTEFARKWRKDHPGEQIDTNDPEYKALLQDHPATLGKADIKRVEKQKLRDELQAETDTKLAKEKAEIDRKLKEVEVAPKVEQQLKDDEEQFTQFIEGDDIKAALDKKGIEGKLARAYKAEAMKHVREFRRVAMGLADYNPADPVHQKITELMDAAGDYYKANHKAELVQDGKKFLTRREWADMVKANPTALSKHWTFSHDQIAQIIMGNHAGALKQEIESLRKDLAEDGYSPAQAKPNGSEKPAEKKAEKEEKPAEVKSPRSAPSPSTGGNGGAKNQKPKLSRFEAMVVGDPSGS